MVGLIFILYIYKFVLNFYFRFQLFKIDSHKQYFLMKLVKEININSYIVLNINKFLTLVKIKNKITVHNALR